MTSIRERFRAWRARRGERRAEQGKWTTVGKSHRPSGGLGHGSATPPGYVPPADEGRPRH